VSILSSDVLRSGARVVTGFWVVGRRSRQKEADVSSTVIFLLALKDHVETRDHLLASERARVRAPWGREGLYSLSNSFCVARKASGGEHSSWRRFIRACARIYEIPPAPCPARNIGPCPFFMRHVSRGSHDFAKLHPKLFAVHSC
jgi:hypothetical protein